MWRALATLLLDSDEECLREITGQDGWDIFRPHFCFACDSLVLTVECVWNQPRVFFVFAKCSFVLSQDAVTPNRRRAELAILPQRYASGTNHAHHSFSASNRRGSKALCQVKVWTRSHENELHAAAASLVKTVIDEANLEPGF